METHTDPYLGQLVWNDRSSWYTGRVRVSKRRSVEVRIEIDADSPPVDIPRASEMVRSIVENVARYKEAIADEHLENYNRTWRGNRLWHPRFLFKFRIRLESITVGHAGAKNERTLIYFSDGGLFRGHVFELYENDAGIQKIALAG